MIELMDDCHLLTGNCVETLKNLEANSVHTCITSPPYYGLRDYGQENGLVEMQLFPSA